MSERPALAGRIRASLEEIKTAIHRAIMLAEKGRRTGDDDYWDKAWWCSVNARAFTSKPK